MEPESSKLEEKNGGGEHLNCDTLVAELQAPNPAWHPVLDRPGLGGQRTTTVVKEQQNGTFQFDLVLQDSLKKNQKKKKCLTFTREREREREEASKSPPWSRSSPTLSRSIRRSCSTYHHRRTRPTVHRRHPMAPVLA